MVVPKRKGPRSDDGFFGPGSVTWTVLGHPVGLTIGNYWGGVYGLLYSEVAHAVRGTGAIGKDPRTRANESIYWVVTAAFGDTGEACRAGKFVLGRHSKVSGVDPVTGREYRPMRPDLAIAGHCLIWEGPLRAYETYVAELTDDERERYWREGLIAAELIGIDPAILPRTWTEWLDYRERELHPVMTYSIAADDIVRNAKAAAYAPAWSRPLIRASLRAVDELTYMAMPASERRLLGGSTFGPRVAATRAAGRVLARVIALPPVRDAIEVMAGGNAHELMSEARRISRAARSRRPAPIAGRDGRPVGAGVEHSGSAAAVGD